MKKAKYTLLALTAAFLLIITGIFIGRQIPSAHKLTPSEDITDSESFSESVLIDINTAGKQELIMLPGIGETIAQRIIEYRNLHGNFRSVNDLLQIEGIGAGKLKAIEEYLTVGGPT